MGDSIPVVSYEEKKEFLLSVWGAEEKRRNGVENKASILIASNAILLSAMLGFVFPLKTVDNSVFWLQIILSIIAFISVIFSILMSAQVLYPIISQKQRSKIMDFGKDAETEYNLILFTRIAIYQKSEYHQEIDTLTEEGIIDQLSSQVHNLSRLLVARYKNTNIAYVAFITSTITFTLLSAIKIFLP